MKILAIRGKNLASLEQAFEVDFTTEPLLSAGIFAITGSTGAGKSTLLDALCLALFDDTPRANQASENIAIHDVGDKTLNQRDCRTILRRGASDGYAEVDFLSLGGEKFRARWSVKRARNKVDGSMQSSEIQLHNLSSGNEEQGRKTELLTRIVELIGLTFDQFTRSVLLAQGDFATFLKAKQAEKAELLEKLTGTDIYSRISMAIYEKSKKADFELDGINRQMQGIELLTEEQTTAYQTEKATISAQIKSLKDEIEKISAQLKWIADNTRLCNEIKQAESNLTNAQKAIADAQTRFNYIAQIESVQDIRDSFKKLENIQKKISDSNQDLKTKTKERDENKTTLSNAEKSVSDCEKEKSILEKQEQDVKPQIVRARALDVQIAGAQKNAEDAKKEFNIATSTKKKAEDNLELLKKSIEQTEKTFLELNQWFATNQNYENIASQTESLINFATDAQSAKEQKQLNETTLKTNKNILDENIKKLDELVKEGERLNKMMPAEIASLRAQLQEGMPCPVCGSIHHPAATVEDMQRMKEQELEKAKTKNNQDTEELKKKIETQKNETTRLSTLIENYTTQYTNAFQKLSVALSSLPDWENLFEHSNLINNLKTRKKQWDDNIKKQTETQDAFSKLQINLANENDKLKETNEALTEKTEKYTDSKKIIDNLQTERQNLLHGKPADKAEQYFVDQKTIITEKLKNFTDKKNILTSKQEGLNSVIAQIQNEITKYNEECHSLQDIVNQWISEKENINYEKLSELLSKNNAWIQAEKQALNVLTETETTTKATLAERKKNFALHNESEIKPTNESDTLEILQNRLQDKNEATKQLNKRNTEVEIALATNEQNNLKIKNLKKEFNDKFEYAENWKKLNVLLGSANGNKFKEIAQRYTLETLLSYANKHLQELTPRYKLQRIPDSLALQVIDLDMLNEVRTIHSLSGGESFLISLALALGLSSLSSNRMKIESLFIDEGFGSLDGETLSIAMSALENLQMQGRKIGVISHVTEMTERIAVQIKINKITNEKSEVKVWKQ